MGLQDTGEAETPGEDAEDGRVACGNDAPLDAVSIQRLGPALPG
jgi:hypothetical protein